MSSTFVVHYGQVPHAGTAPRVDQLHRLPGATKTADEDSRAVADARYGGSGTIGDADSLMARLRCPTGAGPAG